MRQKGQELGTGFDLVRLLGVARLLPCFDFSSLPSSSLYNPRALDSIKVAGILLRKHLIKML
jgi:hypothetical protein